MYNIVIVSDHKYIPHAATMLMSLFCTNPKKQFRIFFITDIPSWQKIQGETEKELREMVERGGNTLTFLPCPLDGIADLPVGQWSTFMYLKLFMPQVLPKDVDRCLFLDVDMVINGDIDYLYNWDLKGSVLAACEDIPDCTAYKPRLGLKATDVYINSGVMVCDIKAWRQMQAECDIFNYTRSIADRIQNEQDVLACYFREKILLLPIRWNMVTFYFCRQPKIFDKYRQELRDTLHQLKQQYPNPPSVGGGQGEFSILHFASPIKPWFRDTQHPYAHLYRHYRNMTPWADSNIRPLRFWELWDTGEYIYEKLTPRKRFNRIIKNWLNKIGIRKESGGMLPVKEW